MGELGTVPALRQSSSVQLHKTTISFRSWKRREVGNEFARDNCNVDEKLKESTQSDCEWALEEMRLT